MVFVISRVKSFGLFLLLTGIFVVGLVGCESTSEVFRYNYPLLYENNSISGSLPIEGVYKFESEVSPSVSSQRVSVEMTIRPSTLFERIHYLRSNLANISMRAVGAFDLMVEMKIRSLSPSDVYAPAGSVPLWVDRRVLARTVRFDRPHGFERPRYFIEVADVFGLSLWALEKDDSGRLFVTPMRNEPPRAGSNAGFYADYFKDLRTTQLNIGTLNLFNSPRVQFLNGPWVAPLDDLQVSRSKRELTLTVFNNHLGMSPGSRGRHWIRAMEFSYFHSLVAATAGINPQSPAEFANHVMRFLPPRLTTSPLMACDGHLADSNGELVSYSRSQR